jgi:hypothetical protein
LQDIDIENFGIIRVGIGAGEVAARYLAGAGAKIVLGACRLDQLPFRRTARDT